jgi:hypothetical protein
MENLIYYNKARYQMALGCALMSYIIYTVFLINFDGQWMQHLWILASIVFSYYLLLIDVVNTSIYEDCILFSFPTKIWDNKRVVKNENISKVKYSHGKGSKSPYPFFKIYYSKDTGTKIKKRKFQFHKDDDPLILLKHFKNLNIPIDFYTDYDEEKKWEREFKSVKS